MKKTLLFLPLLLLLSCREEVYEDGEVLWSITLRGPIRGVPAYHDGVIYVGSDWNRLFAIEEDGYPILWQRVHGDFTGAPVVWEDGTVTATDWWGNMYTYDLKGNLVWGKTEGAWNEYPALYGEKIIAIHEVDTAITTLEWINRDGNVGRVDTFPSGTGALGKANVIVRSDGTVVVSSALYDVIFKIYEDGNIVKYTVPGLVGHASTDDEAIYAVTTGSMGTYLEKIGPESWDYVKINEDTYPIDFTAAQPIIDSRGRVIVLTDKGLYVFTKGLYPLWSYPLSSCRKFRSCGVMMPTPVVGRSGNVYFACGSNLMAVSEDGRLLWFKDFSEDTVKVESNYSEISGLLLIDNRLIVTSCNGKIYSLYVNDTYDYDAPWPMFQANPRRTGKVRVPFNFP